MTEPDAIGARPPLRVGLIVNPIAGIGGPVALKGSDGTETVRRALALGARPRAGARAARALQRLRAEAAEGSFQSFQLLAGPGAMGEEATRAAGIPAEVVGEPVEGDTTAEDTIRIARRMAPSVDLLLFAGGDGTAADVLAAVGGSVPALGIPAGVKIHSAVYAVSPEAAGALVAALARGEALLVADAEVLDIDEDAYREGRIAPRLIGYLHVPREPRLMQARKAPSPASEETAAASIAADVVEHMEPGRAYVLGPGTTVRAIAERLGLTKTLVGVDVVRDRRLVAADVAEDDLLRIALEGPAALVVTPVGGQGFVLGRGDQQIGPRLVRVVGRDHVTVVATAWKLASLAGAPLRVDTGDPEVDAWLAGHVLVTTGYGDRAVYRVEI